MKKHKLIASVIFLFFLFSIGCEKLEENYNIPQYDHSIKIGVVGDVSVLREQVENMFFGAKLASEEINHMGGLNINNTNYSIELIFKNSGGSPEEGIKVTTELINDGVNVIIGPTFSSVAIEMAELCIENGVLMMTYSATTPELTMLNDQDFIWRTCPSDHTFGTVSAQYCFDSLQYEKAAIFYRDDRFGQGLSSIIKENFQELGGQVTNHVLYPGNVPNLESYNFSYELNTLLSEEVDVIFIVAFSSEVAILTNEIYNNELYQQLENKPKLFLNDGIVPEELIINGNPEILETIIGITSTNEGNANYNIYKENYIERFGFSPSTFSEHAYDAVYSVLYATLRAGSKQPEDIIEFLREISGSEFCVDFITDPVIINVNEFDVAKNIIEKGQTIDYEGASGPLNFDCNGDPVPKIVIWGIENNEYKEITYYGK